MIHRPVHCVVPVAGDGSRHDRADAAFHVFHGYPGTWLPAPALPIDGGFRVRLRMPSRSHSPDVSAIVTVGAALHPRTGLSVRSLHWRAEKAHDLFPVLDGDLELHTDDEPLLRLTGSYTPPMSVLGALTDQVVGRHLASEVVRGFSTDVAGRLLGSVDVDAPTMGTALPPVADPRVGDRPDDGGARRHEPTIGGTHPPATQGRHGP